MKRHRVEWTVTRYAGGTTPDGIYAVPLCLTCGRFVRPRTTGAYTRYWRHTAKPYLFGSWSTLPKLQPAR